MRIGTGLDGGSWICPEIPLEIPEVVTANLPPPVRTDLARLRFRYPRRILSISRHLPSFSSSGMAARNSTAWS
jgi:hypothetical protein